MTECEHLRTVQVLGVIFKCTNCGELLTEGDAPPTWADHPEQQRRRAARIEAYKRQNRGR